MDNIKETARKLAEKLAKSKLITLWEEKDKALRSLDTPAQRSERKQREEDAHDTRVAEHDREYKEKARRMGREADREAARSRQEAINTLFTIALTIFGIVLVIWSIVWFCSLFKK
jgi:uncharacterized membrane protein YcjF (UPF0283 family)